jgi:hypothetical protein
MDGECFGNREGDAPMEREEIQRQVGESVKSYMDQFFN